MNIEDVLKEWEKQELLSETDREKRALEEARKCALEETQGIMTEIMGLLKDVIPKIGSIKDGEQKMSALAESLEKVQKSLPLSQGIVEAAEDSREAASAIEAACAEAVEELERMEKADREHKPVNAEAASDEGEVPEENPGQDVEDIARRTEREEEDDAPLTDEDIARGTDIEVEEDSPMPSRNLLRDMEEGFGVQSAAYLKEQMALQEMFGDEGALEQTDAGQDVADEPDGFYGEPLYDEAAGEMSGDEEEVSAELMPELNLDEFMPQEEEEPDVQNVELNEEQKDILSYFMAIGSLSEVLPQIVLHMEKTPEHMIITGAEGSGRTSVAMRIIKAAQVNKEDKIETIAKIRATLLNQKDVTDILDKVNGGVLIIEKAGGLKPSTVYALEEALYSNRYYVQLVLVDKASAIEKLLTVTRSFLNDIRMYVNLPVYTNNELAEFARTYAEANGYILDGMAVLALHSVIEIFQTDKHTANLEDVKNIMDEAMERADKRSNKLFGRLFGRKNTDSIALVESDFE